MHGKPLPVAVTQAGMHFQVALANAQATEMMPLAIGPPEGVPLSSMNQHDDSSPHASPGTIGADAPQQR